MRLDDQQINQLVSLFALTIGVSMMETKWWQEHASVCKAGHDDALSCAEAEREHRGFLHDAFLGLVADLLERKAFDDLKQLKKAVLLLNKRVRGNDYQENFVQVWADVLTKVVRTLSAKPVKQKRRPRRKRDPASYSRDNARWSEKTPLDVWIAAQAKTNTSRNPKELLDKLGEIQP